jgi:hypothetical protein
MESTNIFQARLDRLKRSLGVQEDQEAAEALNLSKAALSARKTRGAFPETELYALAAKRPELKLDVDYILTGLHPASAAYAERVARWQWQEQQDAEARKWAALRARRAYEAQGQEQEALRAEIQDLSSADESADKVARAIQRALDADCVGFAEFAEIWPEMSTEIRSAFIMIARQASDKPTSPNQGK